jgi:hypothetical protein
MTRRGIAHLGDTVAVIVRRSGNETPGCSTFTLSLWQLRSLSRRRWEPQRMARDRWSGRDFPLAAIDRKGITLRVGRRPLRGLAM